jgi:hypothetical protein
VRALVASIVDWAALGKVVLYSIGASVAVGIAFGLAVRGSVRFADMRRGGQTAAATAYGALAAIALALTAAAVGYGIYLMTQK